MNIRGWSSVFVVAVLVIFGVTSCEQLGVHAERENAPDLTFQKHVLVSTDDETFLLNAQKAAVRQITLSRSALEQSNNDHVRAYARQVMTSYQQALTDLQGLLKAKNIAGSYELDATQLEAHNWLISGSAFDHQFVNLMTSEQQAGLALFASVAETTKDPDVRNYAKSALPLLQQNSDTAVALQKTLIAKDRG